MCTRFYIRPSESIQPIINSAIDSFLAKQIKEKLRKPVTLFGEIRPTEVAAVLAPDKNGRCAVFPMIWGFAIYGHRSPIVNARLETAAVKPTFQDSWRCRRCVIPASNYFEWEHFTTRDGKTKTGDKYEIKHKGAEITYLAGLYRFEIREGLRVPVYTVLTKEPTDDLRRIHDRMPLILPENAIKEWIRPDGDPTETAKLAVCDIELQKSEKH